MALPAPLLDLVDWLRSTVLASQELAWFGFGAAVFLIIAVFFWLIRRFLSWLSTAGSAVSAGASGRKAELGYKILMSPPIGRGGGSAFKFLASAADEHMSSFSFDAPLQLSRTAQIKGGRSAKSERAARRRLKRAGADMIVWGERVGRGLDGLCVFTLSRAGGRHWGVRPTFAPSG